MAKKRKRRQTKWEKLRKSLVCLLRRELRWHYFLWGVVVALAVMVVVNHSKLAHWAGHLDWALLKDYLAMLLTWPVAILILGLIFMHRFKESINIFLRKIDRFKAPGVEFSQQQATTPTTTIDDSEQTTVDELEARESDDGSVTLTQEQVTQLRDIYETMDFKFLNLHLVKNTKLALLMMAQSEVKKSVFLQSYAVPSNVTDSIVERQAILFALTEADLIEENGDALKVTEKGVRFLSFTGQLIQQV